MNAGHPVQTELVTRLRKLAEQTSAISRTLAEAKSLRQESNPEGRTDLYMWATPEQTVEGKAATEIERLASSERRLREALAHLCDSIQAENESGIGVSGLLMSDMREGLAALTHKEEQNGN